MRLIQAKTQIKPNTGQESRYIHRLRETGVILPFDQLKVGGYYIYKENFGMVVLVRFLENTSTESWKGFRLKIKKVLYSPWDIPAGTVFETGYSPETSVFPTSWHFEPCMLLIKSDQIPSHADFSSLHVESVL